ncbi:unnamed protein product, partial [Mesorhabditis spiculigera]
MGCNSSKDKKNLPPHDPVAGVNPVYSSVYSTYDQSIQGGAPVSTYGSAYGAAPAEDEEGKSGYMDLATDTIYQTPMSQLGEPDPARIAAAGPSSEH